MLVGPYFYLGRYTRPMTSTPTKVWPTEWLRGMLNLCVLRIVADGPTYGYEISQRLEKAGLGEVKGGTLYPMLAKFVAAGVMVTHWQQPEAGPGRKYYQLTEHGQEVFVDSVSKWADFTDTVGAVLAGD